MSVPVGNILEFGIPGHNWYKADWTIESFAKNARLINKNRELLVKSKDNLTNLIRSEWSWKIKIQNYIRMFDELLDGK